PVRSLPLNRLTKPSSSFGSSAADTDTPEPPSRHSPRLHSSAGHPSRFIGLPPENAARRRQLTRAWCIEATGRLYPAALPWPHPEAANNFLRNRLRGDKLKSIVAQPRSLRLDNLRGPPLMWKRLQPGLIPLLLAISLTGCGTSKELENPVKSA